MEETHDRRRHRREDAIKMSLRDVNARVWTRFNWLIIESSSGVI